MTALLAGLAALLFAAGAAHAETRTWVSASDPAGSVAAWALWRWRGGWRPAYRHW